MKPTDQNRPLRVLEKVLQGGLGKGNVGVIMARHGMGKIAVMTSIAIDCSKLPLVSDAVIILTIVILGATRCL